MVKQRIAESPAGVLNHLKVANHPPPRRAHAKFHATFCETWRLYVYVFPLRQSFHEHRTPVAPIDVTLLNEILNELVTTSEIRETGDEHRNTDHEESLENTETAETATGGVDCYAFARDTIHGKNSLVTFMRARAFVSSVGTESTENVVTASTENVPRCEDTGDKTDQGSLSNDSRCFLESTETNARHDDEKKEKETTTLEQVIVIELVANRFLRKLVRVLVSTAAREAATGAAPDVLLAIAATRERYGRRGFPTSRHTVVPKLVTVCPCIAIYKTDTFRSQSQVRHRVPRAGERFVLRRRWVRRPRGV